ncbi:TetR family transcriptional regulator [Nocardia sp. CA2R105]|uniref:TetR/AcrR family transcriptional regulator n=1 Tax=Nocardia coffeae TaxID=2873381 RepID=UPI001CA6E510|nr:TetR/AcrR family transcriptional regulator [Nocardia coffeae]MBY8859178.1 TetR family transcriptional regulator [Nocardia coffeae]
MTASGNTDPAPTRRPGRPRSPETPDAIRRAATKLFAERGFSGASLRDIATEAGSDPAVVIRHFGSKEKLFLEAVTVAPQLRGLVEGPLDTLGRAILQRLIEADDSTLRLHATLLGALDRPDVRRYLDESTARNIIEPLTERLPGPNPELRAQLIAAQIGGILMSICLFESSAHLRGPESLRYYANAIQTLIDDREN